MALVWLVVAVGLAAAEIFTGTFVLIMLAAGALGAAGAAALGAPIWAQCAVLALLSGLALVLVRPTVRRHLQHESADNTFGLAAIEGATGVVLETVDAENGLVKIEGEMWRARAYDGTQTMKPGERVRVIEVKGATAMVWRE